MIETLLRLSVPTTATTPFLAHEQGVYRTTLTKPVDGFDAYYSTWNYTGMNEERVIVNDVYILVGDQQVQYSRKDTLGDCETDEKSWFFNRDTQTLYIHYEFGLTPESATTTIGILRGYSKNDTQYIDDIKYEARISSTTPIKKKVDPVTVGKMAFQDQTVTLKNGDGGLDGFILNPIPGSLARIVLYDTEADTEREYYTGRVSQDVNTIDNLSIKLLDVRRSENVNAPVDRIQQTDFPYVADKYLDKIIPDGYGQHFGKIAFPVNELEPATPNIQYKFAALADSIDAVWVKIDEEWTEITPLTTDAANGEFVATRADVVGSGKDTAYEVRVDIHLRGSGDAQVDVNDIISDMNDRFAGVVYDASGYNQTEFTTEGELAGACALYMDKESPLFTWFEKLQSGAERNFVYDIQGDGKRTIHTDYKDRSVTDEIQRAKVKSDLMKATRDFRQYASSVVIEYAENQRIDKKEREVNDDYQASAIQKYGFPNELTTTGLFAETAPATTKAGILAEDQSEARPSLDISLHGNNLSSLDKNLYDVISVDTSTPETTEREKVQRVYLDPTASKYYEDPTTTNRYYIHPPSVIILDKGREYLGTFTGKVIEIDYNPTTLDYKLKLREIPA